MICFFNWGRRGGGGILCATCSAAGGFELFWENPGMAVVTVQECTSHPSIVEIVHGMQSTGTQLRSKRRLAQSPAKNQE